MSNLWVYSIVLWVHIAVAVFALGGMFFLMSIIMPVAAKLNKDQYDQLEHGVSVRHMRFVWAEVPILLVSGLLMMGRYWDMPWGPAWQAMVIKLVLSSVMLVFTAMLTLPWAFFDKFRARRVRYMTPELLVGLAALFVSVYMHLAHL